MNKKIVFAILIIIALSSISIFRNITNISMNGDWLHYFSRYAFINKSIGEYHQFPLRNPFFGGGFPSIADPEDILLSPITIFSLLAGEVIGIKLVIFIFYLFAGWSIYYFCRVMKYNLYGSIYTTLTLTLSGWITSRMFEGNYYELYFLFYPLLLAFFAQIEKSKKYLVFSVLLLSMIICGGGKLVFPVVTLFLFIHIILITFDTPSGSPPNLGRDLAGVRLRLRFHYLKNFLVVMVFTCLLSMLKIIPMVQLLRIKSRAIDNYLDTVSYTFSNIWNPVVLLWDKAIDLSNYSSSPLYLGILPLIIFLVASIIRFKDSVKWIVILIVAIFCSMGSNAPVDLFKLLWQLPFFHSILIPAKYFVFFIVFVLVIALHKSEG